MYYIYEHVQETRFFYRQCYDLLLISHAPFLQKYGDQKRNNLCYFYVN